ncbi:hypothetical protein RvY_07541 [Ramazzottius varieornatus]|uniref:Tafazzin family protein n=1 Tax=Ramazzottius varieornatus TaxID=947166 RepID=A0A1D1VC04_RAMVA|nr:hypothetical protein RvY_07541 [Ramazzottius varieornatus]
MDKVRWPFPESPGKLWNVGSGVIITVVASASKLLLSVNHLKVHGKERLLDALENRDKSRGLITVSNHYCCADDPFLWSILPWRHLNFRNLRWGMGAAEICFSNDFSAAFFGMGKVVPVVRGEGVYQRGLEFMLSKLDAGEWVHIFPEARVNQEHQWLRMKWGVGRLIAETKSTPLLLPFHHQGMDSVQANRPPYTPTIGKNVTVLFGSLLDFKENVAQMISNNVSPRDQRELITKDIQKEMKQLRYECETIHAAR